MKKILITAILVVLIGGTGYFAYRYANPEPQQASAPSSSDAAQPAASENPASSQAASSALPAGFRQGASQPGASAPALNSKKQVSGSKQSEIGRIKSAIGLDWKKYTLKAVAAKTLKNKAYDTYEIWDEDYLVGPKVLVDPGSGKVYTWTASDSAPVPASEDKAFDKTVRTVTGTMEDGAMMSIMLKTDDGNEIYVRRLGIDTTGLTSLKIGDRIRVTYTGVIKGNDTSRAFITKLENVK